MATLLLASGSKRVAAFTLRAGNVLRVSSMRSPQHCMTQARLNVLSADASWLHTSAPFNDKTNNSNKAADAAQSNDASQVTDLVLNPLIVCGPSGVGKGTIIQRFMQHHDDQFAFSVSHTTRQPRQGEIHGVHYHFVTPEYMQTAIAGGLFLEHAHVHGNFYGTSWSTLEDVQRGQRKRCLLDIDVQGVKNIKLLEDGDLDNAMPFRLAPKYIFIAPPSLEILHSRLVSRGTETEESLQRRKQNAAAEMEYGMQDGHFDRIVVNDDLDRAVQDFAKAVEDMYSATN
eukprot:CAMPEP_0198116080 /NCGR_PEP_ID=MMETSP1442-20131203/9441_1 /TAXON_ID= /ORGANISM="Craspedostauros australis, Strain CCMP3328" /LENGTH=285 /DNA_ID=CAMNT_0043773771 /DNA_START=203 /DNA_END=1060 /DNA_ORIENTATION=-